MNSTQSCYELEEALRRFLSQVVTPRMKGYQLQSVGYHPGEWFGILDSILSYFLQVDVRDSHKLNCGCSILKEQQLFMNVFFCEAMASDGKKLFEGFLDVTQEEFEFHWNEEKSLLSISRSTSA
jgi:hypothetical protein